MTGISLEHRAIKASMITGLSAVITVIFQIVSVPFCLKYWGDETYGTWIALYSAFLLLRSLDGGFLTYVGNKINYLYYHDAKALRVHLSSAVPSLALIGSFQLLLAAICMNSDWFANLLGIPDGLVAGNEARLGLFVLVVTWVVTCSYTGLLHRLLLPEGMINQAVWWGVPVQTCQFTVVMVAAWLQFGMLKTSILFAGSQLLIYLTSAFYIKNKLPKYYPWWQAWRFKVGLKDLRKSTMLTIGQLIQLGSSNGIVLILAYMAGAATVPIFTTVRTIANIWTTATTVLTTPLLPDVLRFHANSEAWKLWTMNQVYWVLVGSAVNWGILLFYPMIPELYSVWTRDIVQLNKELMCLLLASVVITSAGGLITMHLNAINRVRTILGTSVVRCLFGLGGGFIGYNYIGLSSFGIGILTGEIVTLVLTSYVFIQYELSTRGIKVKALNLVQYSLGPASVILFLIGQGFNLIPTQLSWVMAITGVTIASTLGWRGLDQNIRVRIMDLATTRLKWQKR